MFIDFRSKNGGGSGSGGTTNYNELENKPSLNGITLQGNVSMPIPSKTSDLTNDSDFVDSTALDNEKTRAEQAEEVLDGKIVANTEAIQNKADKSTTYTKDEVDTALSSKAEASDIADIDSKLQSKADSSDVNAIAESLSTTQEIVAQKANIGDSYTKDEADSKFLTEHQDISGKQDVIADLETIREGAALGATAIQEHQSLAEYAKTADIAEAYQPKGDYLTSETDPVYTADKPNIALKSEIPSLDGYATEQWVENKNYITGYTENDPVWNAEKGNYYTKSEVDSKVKDTYDIKFSEYSSFGKSINFLFIKNDGNIQEEEWYSHITIFCNWISADSSGEVEPTYSRWGSFSVSYNDDWLTLVLQARVDGKDCVWKTFSIDRNSQQKLISGTNIKTINGLDILGGGNLVIQGGSGDAYTKAESDALLANKTNTNLDNISDEGKENLKNIIKGNMHTIDFNGSSTHSINSEEAAQKWYLNYDNEIFNRWGDFMFSITQTGTFWDIYHNEYGKPEGTVTFKCTGSTEGIEIYDKATDTKISTDADLDLTVDENSFYIKFLDRLYTIRTDYYEYADGLFYNGVAPLLDVYTKSEIQTNYYSKNAIAQIYASQDYVNNTFEKKSDIEGDVNHYIDTYNFKTINGEDVRGEGDIVIGGSSDEYVITYTAGLNESQFNIYKDGVKITNATINATVQLNTGTYTATADWSTSGYYTFNSFRNDDLYLNVTEILVDSKNILKYPIFVPIRGHLQQTLKSGTNIKSINNTSLLSSGNLDLVPTSYINDANNYAELHFFDENDNETTLLLLKKN